MEFIFNNDTVQLIKYWLIIVKGSSKFITLYYRILEECEMYFKEYTLKLSAYDI